MQLEYFTLDVFTDRSWSKQSGAVREIRVGGSAVRVAHGTITV